MKVVFSHRVPVTEHHGDRGSHFSRVPANLLSFFKKKNFFFSDQAILSVSLLQPPCVSLS